MKPTSVRTRPLVLPRETIRLLSHCELTQVPGGGTALKKSQVGVTCGDCAGYTA